MAGIFRGGRAYRFYLRERNGIDSSLLFLFFTNAAAHFESRRSIGVLGTRAMPAVLFDLDGTLHDRSAGLRYLPHVQPGRIARLLLRKQAPHSWG